MSEQKMSLAHKMALVAAECGYVQKDKRNEFHRYSYASAAAVLEKVNEALSKHRICSTVNPQIIDTYELTTNAGKKERIVTVRTEITLHDGDSGETLTTAGLGSGQDAGDKAVMKALTASSKYCWMLALNISTGDDPEADDETDKRNHEPARPAPAQQQTRAMNPPTAAVVHPAAQPGRNPALLDAWTLVDKRVAFLRQKGIEAPTPFPPPEADADRLDKYVLACQALWESSKPKATEAAR